MKRNIKQYVVRLLGTRPGWPDDMTESEKKMMQDHYFFLKDLVAKKKVILAGPCLEGRYGLMIMQAGDKEEIVKIMDREPSVLSGVHTYTMEPIRVSLLMDYTSPERYVADPSDRVLRKETVLNATIDEVWKAWTTRKGVTSFFAPDARVSLFPGGPFEIYFVPSSPEGLRGSEGCRVLTWLTHEMLCFDWSAPPSFNDLRKKHTRVTVRFEPLDGGKVKVRLAQEGWGKGEDWDKLYGYFDKAWASVLANLKKRFDDGPLFDPDEG